MIHILVALETIHSISLASESAVNVLDDDSAYIPQKSAQIPQKTLGNRS